MTPAQEKQLHDRLEDRWVAARKKAQRTGWDLFMSDSRGLEIERIDEDNLFESDEAALVHVITRASEGDRCALLALAVIGANRSTPSHIELNPDWVAAQKAKREKRVDLRQAALAKLTAEERKVLGLND